MDDLAETVVGDKRLYLLLAEQLAWPNQPTRPMKAAAAFDVDAIHYLLRSEDGRRAVFAEFPELVPVPGVPDREEEG